MHWHASTGSTGSTGKTTGGSDVLDVKTACPAAEIEHVTEIGLSPPLVAVGVGIVTQICTGQAVSTVDQHRTHHRRRWIGDRVGAAVPSLLEVLVHQRTGSRHDR